MNGTADRFVFDRRLFAIAAVLFPLIVLLGFAPTYYLKSLFGDPPLPSAYVHVHGLTMTAWVVLFIAQVRLIAARRVRLHQRLGYAGIGLAALVILTGIPVALRAAKYGSASTPPDIPPLAFMIIPLFDLVVFALLVGAAVYYRRQPAAHKSLMLLTAISLLPPAVARIPVATLQALGPLWFFGLPTALAVPRPHPGCPPLRPRQPGVPRRRGRAHRLLRRPSGPDDNWRVAADGGLAGDLRITALSLLRRSRARAGRIR